METAGDEHTARLLSEKFWACQTFAEAQEFLLARLHAREFTRDIRPHTTLVTGLVVDRWPVHMRAPHKDKMRRLGFPAELPIGEEPIVEFPARIALATADDTVRIQDLKAPVQTDPMRLTGWAHVKAQQTAIDLEGQPDEGLIAAKCKKLTTASTKNSTSRPMMRKYVKYVKEYWGDESEDQEGQSGYMTEANGLNADFFMANHLQDSRYCMYAADRAIQHDFQQFGREFADAIVASENLVQTWSTTGVPLSESIIGWDALTDPVVAARFLGRTVMGRQTPPHLSALEFCLDHRAFLRIDLPVSEVYRVCLGEDEITKKPRSTNHRAIMLRELAMQALRDRSCPAGGREDVQVIYGSLKTANKILKDQFCYPSRARGEQSLRWGSRVPRLPDMGETKRNARNVDARRGFCQQGSCQHTQGPHVEIVKIAPSA